MDTDLASDTFIYSGLQTNPVVATHFSVRKSPLSPLPRLDSIERGTKTQYTFMNSKYNTQKPKLRFPRLSKLQDRTSGCSQVSTVRDVRLCCVERDQQLNEYTSLCCADIRGA